MKIIKFCVLIFCFIFSHRAIAEGSKNQVPGYLKSTPPQKNHSFTDFEKEVAEVDPFVKNDLSLDTKSKFGESVDNFKEFKSLSDRDMEDIFSSTNDNQINNDRENNQKEISLIDKISSQKDEVRINKDNEERLIVGHPNTLPREDDPSLINDVFESPEETEEKLNLSEEKFAHENENQPDRGSSIMAIEEKEQSADNRQIGFNNQGQERKPSNYDYGNKTGSFKSGMYTFSKNCVLYSEPETSSEPEVIIKPGKKLWLDRFNDQWHKAYTKNGPVFLQATCLN